MNYNKLKSNLVYKDNYQNQIELNKKIKFNIKVLSFLLKIKK